MNTFFSGWNPKLPISDINLNLTISQKASISASGVEMTCEKLMLSTAKCGKICGAAKLKPMSSNNGKSLGDKDISDKSTRLEHSCKNSARTWAPISESHPSLTTSERMLARLRRAFEEFGAMQTSVYFFCP